MLTRFKVSGFKNLVDVDVRFGPFTCVAGANGVGKSNLFDAILFLGSLADRPLIDAALSVRDEGGRTADVRGLFHRVGNDQMAKRMTFEAEMIVPESGVDDLGQEAHATSTFLRYSATIAYREESGQRAAGSLELEREELTHITLGEAPKHLPFPHSAASWRSTVVKGARRTPYFISTEGSSSTRVIRLHQDRRQGRPLVRLASSLPRTVLSSATAAESPTALLARREMQSWRLLQLEPTSLRKSDEFTAPHRLGMDGSHLAATLYHLAQSSSDRRSDIDANGDSSVYAQVANRLAELIDDVKQVTVDRDERRELLTLVVTDRAGTAHTARSLSDGTLRFLALSVLDLEVGAQGVLCLEEPENGIHPARIPAMLRLLQDIATDVNEPVGPDNPLRQVIVNTHSPSVVSQVPDDSLIVAELVEGMRSGRRFKHVAFGALPDTWRARSDETGRLVSRYALLAYLNPAVRDHPDGRSRNRANGRRPGRRAASARRVIDRPDIEQLVMSLPDESR